MSSPELYLFFFSSRRRHTRFKCDWSSDVCSSDLSGGSWRGSTGSLGFHVSTCSKACLQTCQMPRQTHRSEEHTSELQSHLNLVCRLLLEKKKTNNLLHLLLESTKACSHIQHHTRL